MAAAIGWLAFRLFARSVSKVTHDQEVARLQAAVNLGVELRETLRREKDAALEVCERRGDDLEVEIRGMYERMLDAAYSAKRRGGPPQPHRGEKEPLEARRRRLATVTCELTEEERQEFAARMAVQLAGGEPPPATL